MPRHPVVLRRAPQRRRRGGSCRPAASMGGPIGGGQPRVVVRRLRGSRGGPCGPCRRAAGDVSSVDGERGLGGPCRSARPRGLGRGSPRRASNFYGADGARSNATAASPGISRGRSATCDVIALTVSSWPRRWGTAAPCPRTKVTRRCRERERSRCSQRRQENCNTPGCGQARIKPQPTHTMRNDEITKSECCRAGGAAALWCGGTRQVSVARCRRSRAAPRGRRRCRGGRSPRLPELGGTSARGSRRA